MKCKQLLSVILMLCMVASSVVSFAAPAYDAKYECSPVSFGYEDGEVWTDAVTLEGGKAVSAKVTAKTTGEKENMVFSLFVYDDGKMIDCEIVTREVTSEGTEFKASADVPADTEGCHVVAMLWNNFYDMDMICDAAIYPAQSTKLRGLYMDGVLVEGFDPDVTEYSYAIAGDAEKYPDISWQAADSSVKVTYTKPSTFPGRSVVTVEAADGTKTEYSIKYVSEVGDFISNIGGAATNPVYVKGGIKVGEAAYNDRNATPTSYIITAIGDPNYEGADMIQGSIGWQNDATFKSTASDWITFDAARGVTVKVLKSDTGATQHFIDAGFTMETTDLETGFVQTYTNAVKNHKIAMSKHFNAGKVSIPAGGSGTTYIVAILLDPIGGVEEDPDEPDEPVVPEDTSLMLESISIDGTALEGFDASTTEYDHILTTAQLANMASPEVTFTLMDETSTAEVSRPESFPGSVTITVTNTEEETAEYVINYDAKNMVTNLTTDAEVTRKAVYVPGGLKIGGNVASDRMGETQWKISEHVPALEGGDTILTPVDGWMDVVSTFSFDLARKGTLTVVQNKTNMLSAYTDIGFVADADVKSTKLKILNGAGTDSRTYLFMASKAVEAGKITLPYTKPNMPTLTVFHVEPWSNEAEPDRSTLLSDIKIDGVSVADFDSEENTYYAELTPAQLAAKEAPTVTYTFADGESSAIMEMPSSFPGSVKITVYGKDSNTNTYTINYSAETVKDLALNEAAGENAPQPVYKQDFKIGDATYSDRDSNFLTSYIDEAYVGKDRILYGLGWKNDYETQYCTAFTGEKVDWVTFTAARDMEVIVFEAANADSEYTGFTAETSTTPYITAHASSNGDLNYKYKYTKTVSAGEVVSLPNVDVSNRIGTVVINAAPWGGFGEEGGDEPVIPPVDPDEPVVPEEPVIDSLALTNIRIDGNAVNEFDPDITEYSYTLTPNQVASIEAPTVTYTLADAENSSAVVTNPTEFPGSVTITVTNKDSQTRTYTVNYKSNAVLTDITVADSSVRNADFVSGGFVVGEAPYYNRTSYTIQEINDESLVGKDYFKGNIEWQSNATFSSATYTPWITLNSQREVKVTILKTVNNGDAAMLANGFTPAVSTNANGFVKADTNSAKNFKYAYTKEFDAGEVVIPNGMTNKAYFVVFSYAPWGTEDAEESDEPFYDQSIEVAPYNGDILVSGSFRANTEEGKGYYVVLESYEDDELVKTEKSDKIDLADGKNTFNISFAPSFAVQNVRAYVEAEDGTVICQPEELTVKTLKHLFIGNSFSVNAHKHLYQIAQDAGFNNIVLGTIYKGGCSLETHASYAENNTAGYTYYKNISGTWNSTQNSTMLYGIKDEDWTTISLQQASTYSYRADSYEPYLSELIEYVEDNKTNPDAKFVWHMTWAYAEEKFTSSSQTAMYEGIVSAVESKVLSTDKFDIVIPSGTAIQNARTSTVGDTLNSDGTHLEEIHGCYIAGLMTFKALTGEDISGITYDPGFTHDNFLAIAKESVNNAYAKPYEVTESQYAPEEVPQLVKAIKIDGNPIADFDAETLTYDVTLTDNQMAASAYPDVTAELNDTEASVEVTEPTSFPGSVNVTVTKGEETKTYTINYKTPDIDIALTADAPASTPKPAIVYGAKVGDYNFKDRSTTFGIIAVNDEDITEDTLRIKTCIGWQTDNNSYSELYLSGPINDWLSFTAPRAMIVTVYEDTSDNASLFNYWTTESSSTPYIEAAASNSLKYKVKHRRVFEAGDKVELPNARGGRTFTATINYIGWNEEAPELDVTIPVVKKISDSDLVMKVTSGDGKNVTEGQWSGLSIYTRTKYQLSKEFANITEPTEISITADKIAKGYGIIVVAPLDSEAADKNVIVNTDGSELQWTEDTGVVADYAYTNGGDEDFDEANATFGRYNAEAVTFSGGTAYVYEKMHNSDEMYITGSKLGWGRDPYDGGLHWTGLPEEYIGCNYIVVDFNTGFDGTEKTFTFTVDQPVKVWVHSSTSDMTVTDTADETEWTASQYVVRRRYQNVLDHLSCAYMLRKGYINESNIVYDGTVGGTNGVRFNRYDVYEKLKADCGSYLGWAIDPEKVEATGFTASINSYRYEEYLEAWVD